MNRTFLVFKAIIILTTIILFSGSKKKLTGLELQQANEALIKEVKKSSPDFQVIKMLIKDGANPDVIDSDFDISQVHGATILMIASYNEDIDLIKLLLKNGADINVPNRDGVNALMVSSMYGKKEIVELLISMGADANAVSNDGDTALSFTEGSPYKIEEIINILKKAEKK
jgi:ankyrin repeat protein